MRGHEYVRDVISWHLSQFVPPILAAHLADIGETEPNPADLSFILADSLQEVPEGSWPVVAVRSTLSPKSTRITSRSYERTYRVEVMVACDHHVYGEEGYEVASRARDRLIGAVRDAFDVVSGIDTDEPDGQIRFLQGNRPEAIGKGNAEDLVGVALAVGTKELMVACHELLPVWNPPESITTVDLTVSGADASQSI